MILSCLHWDFTKNFAVPHGKHRDYPLLFSQQIIRKKNKNTGKVTARPLVYDKNKFESYNSYNVIMPNQRGFPICTGGAFFCGKSTKEGYYERC